MKTLRNPRKIFKTHVCIGGMLMYRLIFGSIQAQTEISTLQNASLTSVLLCTEYEKSAAPVSFPHKNNSEVVSSNKVTLKKVFQFTKSLIRQKTISHKSKKEGPYDVIIVPGFPYHDEKKTSLILKNRIKWACNLIRKGVAKNIIFSGSSVYTPYVESEIMALYATELGISQDQVYCETNAEHSTENLVYSLKLAEKLGFKKVAVATGPFQSAILNVYAENQALTISFIPIGFIFSTHASLGNMPEINPSPAYVKQFVSIKERESRSERFQGTLGNNIKEENETDLLASR